MGHGFDLNTGDMHGFGVLRAVAFHVEQSQLSCFTMNSSGESQIGCLGKLLKLLGITLRPSSETSGPLPYLLRDDFLSLAERSFYGVLVQTLGPDFVVCPKVNVADILYVSRPSENLKCRNKIDRKHVDFLVCHAATMVPCLAVELDDASHAQPRRRARDEFMDEAFRAAGFPLLHVAAKQSYNTVELKEKITQMLKPDSAEVVPSPVALSDSSPVCPKCSIPMVKRMAKHGERAGQPFWGCVNYPKCRQTVVV